MAKQRTCPGCRARDARIAELERRLAELDRKSTRLNSSHLGISYAVFCLKKKKKHKQQIPIQPKKQKHPRINAPENYIQYKHTHASSRRRDNAAKYTETLNYCAKHKEP